MWYFLRNFAEVPGACLLVLVASWQILIAAEASEQVLMGHIRALENQMYDICSRITHLEIQNGNRAGVCDRFPYDPAPYEDPGSFTWPEVKRFASAVESWTFGVGLVLFVVGMIVRLSIIGSEPE